ncbi:prephenate dehydratase [Natranaerofaba carboxydovora]|uniref:prephenate dehydratase n=1 Tax=Natranaerofaba carboxydovora TaxID=2742683 RepID=UPI001F1396F2|nr:prephenate dehydratase [Natranaerofaba carboxydovora]UMZ74841.1 Prephenate dehydratase [Natranaerofaba carboxydovora]
MENTAGYLGPPGTFSSEAADKISDDIKPYQSIREVVDAIENREIKLGVLPIENSLEGAVTETMDLLLEVENTIITQEIILPIRYVLLANPGEKLENIDTVISHSQALAQCRELFVEYPHLEKEISSSTAGAAEKVQTKEKAAALAPASCNNYSLDILWEGPKKQYNNETRFIVLGHEPPSPTGDDRTSIVFGIEDSPGALYKSLEIFSKLEINLTRIESRPSKRKLGEYVFYVDFEGHKEERRAYQGLKGVEKNVNFLKVLGSYPKEYGNLGENKITS